MSEFKPIGEILRQSPSPLTTPNPRDSRSLPQVYKQGREMEKRGERKRVAQGKGEGGVDVMYVICRCFQCGGQNWFALDRNKIRPYSKCQVCGEISPTASYIVLVSDYDVDGKPLWQKWHDRA
jgi:hypothetical protein